MNSLPILRRELLVQARRRATYRVRLGVVAFGLCVCLPFLLDRSAARLGGKALLDALVVCLFALSCGAGVFAADTVSREKREGTLGLLLMTRVKVLDLVLGKLGSMGITALCAVAALSPLLMLPLLAGGVTGGEVVRKSLVIANTLLLSIAIGLNASASQERVLAAARRALLTGLIIFALPLGPWHFAAAPWKWLGLLSPVTALLSAADNTYNRGETVHYWSAMVLVQAETWTLLLGTVLWLRRGLSGRASPKRAWRDPPLSAAAEERRQSRWNPLTISPVEWLVRRQPGVQAAFWTAAILSGLIQSWIVPMLFGFLPRSGAGWYFWIQLPYLAFALMASALNAWGASRFFLEARQNGAIELLLTTPAGSQELINGQWAALKRMLRGPLVLMALPVLIQLLVYLKRSSPAASAYSPLYVLVTLANIYLSVAAICWVGVFFGSRASGQASAIACTLAVARALPYCLTMVLWVITFPLLRSIAGAGFGGGLWPQTVVSLLVGLFYLFLIRQAKRKLQLSALRRTPGSQSGALRELIQKTRSWPPAIP
jgi:hypothetical protein